ncbi:MAG: chemotaxis protein CheB, partial [Planctomycetes bacterium]|nr:chemotaxis protein CheB [Planctomycetota bacterium]
VSQMVHGKAVYLAPSGYHLLIDQGPVFSLSLDQPEQYSLPSVDVLFASAADVYREQLVGVILTGANSDGARGLSRIRDYGGLAVVQDPKSAEAAQMPESAISIAGADFILPLDEIASFLIGLDYAA